MVTCYIENFNKPTYTFYDSFDMKHEVYDYSVLGKPKVTSWALLKNSVTES